MKPPYDRPMIPEQESWFRLMFERSADAIFLFDPRREVFVDCNAAAMALLGATDKAQILMATPQSLSPEFQLDGTSSAVQARMQTEAVLAKGTHRFEWMSRRLDGTVFPVEVSLTAVQNVENPMVAAVCRDISERRAHQEALARSEEQFRTLFERSADAMFLLDPETGRFTACNRALIEALGLRDCTELLGRTQAEIAPARQPDGRPSGEVAREVIGRAFQNGSHRYEWMLRRKDGTHSRLELVSTALPVGGRTLLLTVARNIEEQKRLEAELRVSEVRWRRVFEQMPMSIQLFAPDGTTRRVNHAFVELFQMSLADLKEFNIRRDAQLAAAGFLPLVERAFGGEVVTLPPIPFELRAGGGETSRGRRWVGATMFPLQDSEGRLLEVVCVHQDITDRKRAEDDIRQLNAGLEQRITERTAELQASEARLRTLIDHAPEAIVVFDGETGRFLECNENACRLWGLDRATLLQLGPWDV
ncbi:MAG TPA: hypothetical protein DCY13_04965, partial [Verrucomicrobiales bacterium]|nr:hypothetical protein [Verrucomicrobiales bacterium]